MRSLHSATVLPSNSYYTVVASIFLVSAASCKAICRVASVKTSDYSHALLMPHVLIKYAHVLICISVGEGSWHFSAFHLEQDMLVNKLMLKKQYFRIEMKEGTSVETHIKNMKELTDKLAAINALIAEREVYLQVLHPCDSFGS